MDFKKPEDFHQKINFRFHAMLAVPLALFVYLFLEIKHRELEPIWDGMNSVIFEVLMLIAGVALALYAVLRLRSQLKLIDPDLSLKEKIQIYYQIYLRFYVYTLLSSGILVVGLYVTTSAYFIIAYVFLLFYLSLKRPAHQMYVQDLPLSKEERESILKKRDFPAI